MFRPIYFLLFVLIAVGCNNNDSVNQESSYANHSGVRIHWDTSVYPLNYCTAEIQNNNLILLLQAKPDSLSNYELEILKQGDSLTSDVRQTWSVTDCSYVTASFKTISQHVELNKPKYEKGEVIQGHLNLLLLGRKDYVKEVGEDTLRANRDTIKVEGTFSATVQ